MNHLFSLGILPPTNKEMVPIRIVNPFKKTSFNIKLFLMPAITGSSSCSTL